MGVYLFGVKVKRLQSPTGNAVIAHVFGVLADGDGIVAVAASRLNAQAARRR